MSEISAIERTIDNLGLFVCIPKRSQARRMCEALSNVLRPAPITLVLPDVEALTGLYDLLLRAFGDDL